MKKSDDEIQRLLGAIGEEEELLFDEFEHLLKGCGRFTNFALQSSSHRKEANSQILMDTGDPNHSDPADRLQRESSHPDPDYGADISIDRKTLSLLVDDTNDSKLDQSLKGIKKFLRSMKNVDHYMRVVFPVAYLFFMFVMMMRMLLSPPVQGDFKEFVSPKNYHD